MSSLTPKSHCSPRKQHSKQALKELVSGHVPSPCRFWKWLLQRQSCPELPRWSELHVREGADAAGRVADVPHFDVRRGHGEHQPRVAAVLDGNHIVWVPLERSNFLACHQVPHFAAAVCARKNMPKSVGGVSSKGTVAWGRLLSLSPHPQGQRKGASQTQHGGRTGQGSALKTGITPLMPNISHVPNANLLPQHLHPPCPCAHHSPLDPVKSSSSVASRQSTGLVCPSATETHCRGAVRAFLVPPTGLMMPLHRRERTGTVQGWRGTVPTAQGMEQHELSHTKHLPLPSSETGSST